MININYITDSYFININAGAGNIMALKAESFAVIANILYQIDEISRRY
ncbi:MAG: hypothetical protein K2J39_07265 [Ruminococcus sp.]|nr:hypothetical protein [Ruminococcus sp.]